MASSRTTERLAALPDPTSMSRTRDVVALCVLMAVKDVAECVGQLASSTDRTQVDQRTLADIRGIILERGCNVQKALL